jgi:predicted metal-binding membrane protein
MSLHVNAKWSVNNEQCRYFAMTLNNGIYIVPCSWTI